MTIVPLIQARMNSERLPGKVMMKIEGQPMLAHVVLAAAEIAPPIVVVPFDAVNEPIRQWCRDNDVAYSSWPVGDIRDPLAEFVYATRAYGPYAWVIRLTADCPMIQPHHLSMFCCMLDNARYGTYMTNRPADMDGYDIEAFTVGLLRITHIQATGSDREHVCPYMYRDRGSTVFSVMGNPHSGITPGKVSVDTLEEFNYVKQLMEASP